jgi:sulfite exporter TauE/SafE
MVSYLIEGFLLGLAVSPLCLAYCAPILAPFVTSEEKLKIKGTTRLLVLFLLGRLVGYVVIGFLTGIAGSALFKNGKSMFPAIITIVTGMILFFYGLLKNFPGLKLCSYFGNKNSSIIFMPILGLLTGLNICPPFVAAIIRGVNPWGHSRGGVLFYCFFYWYPGTVSIDGNMGILYSMGIRASDCPGMSYYRGSVANGKRNNRNDLIRLVFARFS